MKLPRRRFLHLAAGVAALPFAPHVGSAQAYPSRAVRIVVPYPAGGSGDILARLIGQWLSERLGQPFIVDNRPGAATNIGTETVIKAQPDGYTLLLASPANAINATLYEKLSFNFIRDTVPIASIQRISHVVVVHPSVPISTVQQLIDYARSNAGKINMASGGNGSASHVCGELFKMMTGINMVHVPYRGAAAMTDLIGGQVQVMFPDMPTSIEYIRSNKLRALAVTTASRSDALPSVPTVGETLPGYEASAIQGIAAPKNTPPEIVEKLNRAINAALVDPKIKTRLADIGGAPLVGSSADYATLIASETEKWGKVIKFASIKPD
jgi:tripartite-type tricarboxylate transporter receptor subunit TctC